MLSAIRVAVGQNICDIDDIALGPRYSSYRGVLPAIYLSPYSRNRRLYLGLLNGNDGDSNERRWPAGNQPTDTPSVDKRRDEERGDRSRRAREGR